MRKSVRRNGDFDENIMGLYIRKNKNQPYNGASRYIYDFGNAGDTYSVALNVFILSYLFYGRCKCVKPYFVYDMYGVYSHWQESVYCF